LSRRLGRQPRDTRNKCAGKGQNGEQLMARDAPFTLHGSEYIESRLGPRLY
jgi:hypothetical protein